MTWSDYKTTIQGVLTGYTEIKKMFEPKDAPSVFLDKCYSLKPIGLEPTLYSGGAISNDFRVELKIGYLSLTNADRDTNFIAFQAIEVAVFTLASVSKSIQFPTFSDTGSKVGNKYLSIGTIIFTIGTEGAS